MTDVCWVDCETSGLHPTQHQIYEVGLILPTGGQLRWFLPVDLGAADPFALDIGGFHRRHPAGYAYEGGDSDAYHSDTDKDITDYGLTDPASFAQQFAHLTFGLHMAGAVISFDDRRLADLLRAHGEQPAWFYHIIDVEALAAGHIAGSWQACNELRSGCENHHGDGPSDDEYRIAVPPWDSSALSVAVGVDPEDFDRHTALGDCRWARALYQAVLG